jgi:tetratricopeptide (TPR) repeat protein
MIRIVILGRLREGMLSRKGIIALVVALRLGFGVATAAPSQSEPTYDQAVEALYNLDFSIAERAFDSLIQRNPDNPDYWNGRASTILLKILFDQQKFNSESFTGSSIGTRSSKNAVDAADETKLRNNVATAISKANAVLTRNPKDARALYALGVANATLASFEGLARRSYMPAHSKAKLARNFHQQVLRQDPNFVDAKLSVGVYDYGIGVLPWTMRLLLGIVGISGDKVEGIHNLELVASKGARASTDAKLLLIVIYERERRFDDALRLIDELLQKYPRNFQLEISKAAIYGKMKNWDEATSVYGQVLAKVQTGKNGYDRLREEFVYHELGKSDVNRLKLDEAIAAFSKVTTSDKSTADEKADSHVWLGMIFDSRNERSKAVEQYNAVLKLNCDEGYKDSAQAFLKRPYKG